MKPTTAQNRIQAPTQMTQMSQTGRFFIADPGLVIKIIQIKKSAFPAN
jgi:hypothetical protein